MSRGDGMEEVGRWMGRKNGQKGRKGLEGKGQEAGEDGEWEDEEGGSWRRKMWE